MAFEKIGDLYFMKKNKINNNRKLILGILFCGVVILQIIFLAFLFLNYKKGFHSDEPWTYGFSNSYYEPYIYATGNFNPNEPSQLKNFGEWKSGDIFHDYLTVQESERFTFDSIYYNSAYDQSPPLYSILLHFICSFWPDTFSLWFGLLLNIVAFAICQAAIFYIVYRLSGSGYISILVNILYGFSVAAINTVVFIRMYALLTMFTLLYIAILTSLYKKAFIGTLKEYIMLTLVVMLGAFTHYSFLVFAFFMTLLQMLFLFVINRWHIKKEMVALSGTTLLGVAAMLLVYPSAKYCILQSRDLSASQTIQMPFWFNWDYLLTYFSEDTLGVPWLYDRYCLLNTVVVLLLIICILAMFVFVCRHEKWFQPFMHKVISPFLKWISNREKITHFVNQNVEWFCLILFFAMFATIAFNAHTGKIFEMGRYSDRYVMYMMPVFDILVVCLCIYVWKHIFYSRRWIAYLITFLMIMSSLLYQKQSRAVYLFPDDDLRRLTQITKDSNTILLTNKAWSLEWYSAALLDVHTIYAINAPQFLEQIEIPFDDVGTEKRECYLLLERACFIDDDGMLSKGDKFDLKYLTQNMGNGISESTFIKSLMDINPCIDELEYEYTQQGFRGEIDVYKVHIK